MSWDRKGNSGNSYYYRSVRSGAKVSKQYYGCGAEGKAVAQQDLAIRRQRLADKDYWDRVIDKAERTLITSALQVDLTRLMMHVTLVANGY